MVLKVILYLFTTFSVKFAYSDNCPQCPIIKIFERSSLDRQLKEVQFQNFSTQSIQFILSDSIFELQFKCTSNYPTKWRLHPSPQRFSTLRDWSITKERIVGDMKDKSTIKDKDLNRHIYLTTSDSGVLQGRITARQELTRTGASSRYGRNKDCSMIMRIDLESHKAACDNTKNLVVKKPYIIQCSNSDECEGEVQSEKPEYCPENRNESLVRNCSMNDKCEKFSLMQPGAMICWVDNDIATSLARVIYMTIERPPRLYISRTEDKISVQQVLKVEPVNKTSEVENLHTYQTLTFTCTVSMSVFTRGSQWAIEFNSGEIAYLGRGHEEIMNHEARVYESRISLRCNSTDITKVICYGPLWNSDEWEQDSFPITVHDSEPPKNIKLSISNKTIAGRTTNGKFSLLLICEAMGKPLPKFRWLKNGSEFLVKEVYKSNQSSTISKSVIEIEHLPSKVKEQTFTCIAQNMLGSVNETRIVHNNDFLEPPNNPNHLPYLIGIPVALAVIILVFCFYHVWRVRRNEKLIQRLTEDEIEEFKNGDPYSQSQALFYPYNTEFEIPMKQVHFESKVLGDGFFGLVTRGKIGKAPIAIKTVKKSADIAYLKALLDELKIMCYVGKHEYIVSLIGACTENIRKREVYILFEYCENGNVLKYLQNSREIFVDHLYNGKFNCSERLSTVDYQNISVKKLSSKDLVKWAFEIASGMEFLTRKNIIHGDLAARNVLLTDTLQAKIGDFGLSKQLYNYSIYVQKLECPLPLKWMAIESLRDLEFSIKSDIWSYGVTLFEIFSLGQSPYPGLQWDTCSWKLLLDGYRMECPTYASDSIYLIMLKCWEENPDNRPPFTYLMNYFEEEMLR